MASGTASESACAYNSATGSTPNDVLGLIANNFVEVNRPVYNNNASWRNGGNGPAQLQRHHLDSPPVRSLDLHRRSHRQPRRA